MGDKYQLEDPLNNFIVLWRRPGEKWEAINTESAISRLTKYYPEASDLDLRWMIRTGVIKIPGKNIEITAAYHHPTGAPQFMKNINLKELDNYQIYERRRGGKWNQSKRTISQVMSVLIPAYPQMKQNELLNTLIAGDNLPAGDLDFKFIKLEDAIHEQHDQD